VAHKLRLEWSPEQIAGWLKRAHPDDEAFQVSHETIYRSLFIQARGALKKELMAHLRRTRGTRRSRHHTQKTISTGKSLTRYRSASVPLRSKIVRFPGHWEGDLLFGSKNSQIATLVERQSRYVMLAKVGKKDTETVVERAHQARAEAAERAVPIADLGPRQRDGRPPTLYAGHRHQGLLL
jgi:IS30 family transposase